MNSSTVGGGEESRLPLKQAAKSQNLSFGESRMKLDRSFQLNLLQGLSDAYPDAVAGDWTLEHEQANANISYLTELGLVANLGNIYLSTPAHHRRLCITAKGLDLLAEDGGLGAVLSVVTVKLHDDSLSRIQDWIRASDAPPEEKQRVVDQLRSLPADATKHLVLKLLDAGLANAPAAWSAVRSVLASLS